MLATVLITISLLSQIALILIVGCGKKNKKKEEPKPLAGDDKGMVTGIADKSAKSNVPSKAASAAAAPEKKDDKKDDKPASSEIKQSAAGGAPSDKKEEKKDEKESSKKEEKPKEEKKEGEGEGEKKEDDKKDDASTKNRPYPEVKDPTPSEIEKKKKALEKEKAEKIANGDYQKKSDEDDTLEKVVSLKEEQTEKEKAKKKAAEGNFRSKKMKFALLICVLISRCHADDEITHENYHNNNVFFPGAAYDVKVDGTLTCSTPFTYAIYFEELDDTMLTHDPIAVVGPKFSKGPSAKYVVQGEAEDGDIFQVWVEPRIAFYHNCGGKHSCVCKEWSVDRGFWKTLNVNLETTDLKRCDVCDHIGID